MGNHISLFWESDSKINYSDIIPKFACFMDIMPGRTIGKL